MVAGDTTDIRQDRLAIAATATPTITTPDQAAAITGADQAAAITTVGDLVTVTRKKDRSYCLPRFEIINTCC
jgi:hypothetical protein